MFKPTFICLSAIALLFLGTATANAQSATPQPDEVQALYACKAISAPLKRLECYDNSVGRFEAAEQSGEVVTVSKTAIEKVERDAFGFNIPSLPSLGNLFRGRDKTQKTKITKENENDLTAPVKTTPVKEAARPQPTTEPSSIPALAPKPSKVKEVTLDILRTTEFGYKKTRFFMANGQVWEQADTAKVRVPKVRNGKANTAEISKASLGSFFLRVNGKSSAIRVRRVR